MESSFGPFGGFFIDFCEEFYFELILFFSTLALEFKMSGGEFYLLVGDIHEGYLKEDAFFALSPFDQGVTT